MTNLIGPTNTLELPQVTLCCVDTVHHKLALRALDRSRRGIRFARAILLTDALPSGCIASDGIDVVPIGRIASSIDYSQFMLKSLLPHIETTYALVVQWDGYVVHPEMWNPEFLDCDYIGAKWPHGPDGMRVGNGGFSLRSRKLLEALQNPFVKLMDNEDATICRIFRPLLEHEHGIRFADEGLADQFSFEMVQAAAIRGAKTFGFHGIFNFGLAESEDEVIALARELPETIVRSSFYPLLLNNCIQFSQWRAASTLAERLIAAEPENVNARDALALVRPHLTAAPAHTKPSSKGRLLRWLRRDG